MIPSTMNGWAVLGLLLLVGWWSLRLMVGWVTTRGEQRVTAETDRRAVEAGEIAALRCEVERLMAARRKDETRHASELRDLVARHQLAQQAMTDSMAALAGELADTRRELSEARTEIASLRAQMNRIDKE